MRVLFGRYTWPLIPEQRYAGLLSEFHGLRANRVTKLFVQDLVVHDFERQRGAVILLHEVDDRFPPKYVFGGVCLH
jgi:hypothetical protein